MPKDTASNEAPKNAVHTITLRFEGADLPAYHALLKDHQENGRRLTLATYLLDQVVKQYTPPTPVKNLE